jgi:hypothetical protein
MDAILLSKEYQLCIELIAKNGQNSLGIPQSGASLNTLSPAQRQIHGRR